MSKFRQGGKPSRPVIVTSRKKAKAEARLANEYGKQRQKAIRIATERAEEIQRAVQSSNNLHAIGAAAREAAWSEQRRNAEAMKSFQRRHQDIDVTLHREVEPETEVQMETTVLPEGTWVVGGEESLEPVDLIGDDNPPYPVTTEWAAEDDGWMTPETGWKNAIFRMNNSVREVLNCPHKHKAPKAARACALKAARARNASSAPAMDGWKADVRYPWTDGRVTALIDELRTTPKG